jgi:hypothetical protein
MSRGRLIKFLAGHELGVSSTLLFAGLYTWPFLTFDRPSATFRFIFAVWAAHIVLISITSFASKRLEASETASSESESSLR